MAIDYNSGTGLFDVLGSYISTLGTIRTLQSNLETRYELHPTKRAAADQGNAAAVLGALEADQASVRPAVERIFAAAAADLIDVADAETKLATTTIRDALVVLRDEMTADAETIDFTAPGSSTTAGSGNTGDGSLLVDLEDTDGTALHHVKGETLRIICTRDGQDSVQFKGREVFEARGEAAVPRTSHLWPAGSGATKRLNVLHAGVQGGTGTNQNAAWGGDFEAISSNLPERWTLDVGAAGTDIAESSANPLRGSKALQFVGDGATLTALSQSLDARTGAGGTPGKLLAATKYAVGFWVRQGTAAAGAGNLRLSVKDGGGTILDSGAAAAQIALATVSSSYQLVSATFNTPATLPASTELVLELTVAIDSAKDVYVDELFLSPMVQLYPGGPYVLLVAGEADFVRDDYFDLTITQNNGTSNFIHELDRLFDLGGSGVVLPTSGTPTISDALIA